MAWKDRMPCRPGSQRWSWPSTGPCSSASPTTGTRRAPACVTTSPRRCAPIPGPLPIVRLAHRGRTATGRRGARAARRHWAERSRRRSRTSSSRSCSRARPAMTLVAFAATTGLPAGTVATSAQAAEVGIASSDQVGALPLAARQRRRPPGLRRAGLAPAARRQHAHGRCGTDPLRARLGRPCTAARPAPTWATRCSRPFPRTGPAGCCPGAPRCRR